MTIRTTPEATAGFIALVEHIDALLGAPSQPPLCEKISLQIRALIEFNAAVETQLQSHRNALQGDLTTKEQRYTDLTARREQTERESQDLQGRVSALQQEENDLSTSIRQAEDAVEHAKRKAKQKKKKNGWIKVGASLIAGPVGYGIASAATRPDEKHANRSIGRRKEEHQELIRRKNHTSQELENKRRQCQSLEEQIASTQREKEETQGQIQQLAEEISSIASVSTTLKQMGVRYHLLKDDVELVVECPDVQLEEPEIQGLLEQAQNVHHTFHQLITGNAFQQISL